jgi:ketosteroid isomerase-like protein
MLTLRTFVAVSAMLLSSSAFAQSITGVQGQTPAEREVRAAEDQMHKAYVAGDKELFRSLYTDDSTFTYSRGETVSRDERVRRLGAFKDLRDEIASIKVVGDVALVRCISRYSNQTQPGETQITILRVWQQRAGKWQVLAFQSTPVVSAK